MRVSSIAARGVGLLVLLVLGMVASPSRLRAATIYTLGVADDNTIVAGAPNNNYGSADQIQTGKSAGAETSSLIRFDASTLAGVLDGTNYVSSISMQLTLKNFESTGLKTTEVYAISAANAAWLEGNTSWNNRITSPATAWTGGAGLATAGVSYDSALLSVHSYTSATVPADNTAITFNFAGTDAEKTSLIQTWADGVNAGLLLLDPNGASLPGTLNRLIYHSNDDNVASYRPQLLVTIEQLPPVPEPGSLLLLTGGLALLGTKVRRKKGQRRASTRA